MSNLVVSEARMNKFRAQAQASMDKTVVIKRQTQVVDTVGGYTTTYATVATTVAEVAPLRGSSVEGIENFQIHGELLWWFELPYNTDVRLTDRIEMDGLVYEVGYVADPESFEVMQRVVAQQLV